MLYNLNEYLKFALICSDYQEQKHYAQPSLDLNLLTPIFLNSLTRQQIIFTAKQEERKEIIQTTFAQNSYYQSRVQKAENIFLAAEYLAKLNDRAAKELRLGTENEINYLPYESKDYPAPLKEIAHPPILISYQGQLPSDKELNKSIAVIGSRDCEEYGQNIAHSTGKIFSTDGWWNISGLATGCDTHGHQGSLAAQGLTGAVLAHGLAADIYPPENKDLAADILDSGGFLVSELAPSTSPAPHFFTWRDRLQSGLTRAIIVVETGKKGGTLHTINYALRQDKQVYVWEPTTPSLLPHDKIEGNLILAGHKEVPTDFKIKSAQRLAKINTFSCPRKLKDSFDKLTVEELSFDF